MSLFGKNITLKNIGTVSLNISKPISVKYNAKFNAEISNDYHQTLMIVALMTCANIFILTLITENCDENKKHYIANLICKATSIPLNHILAKAK